MKLSEIKQKFEKQVADYVYLHPQETVEGIGLRFGISHDTVRKFARRNSVGPRKPGRKLKARV